MDKRNRKEQNPRQNKEETGERESWLPEEGIAFRELA